MFVFINPINKYIVKFQCGELLKTLFEKIISLDFLGLNVTCHLFAQLEIFLRSLFSISDVSVGSLPEAKRVVSSAKFHFPGFQQYHL